MLVYLLKLHRWLALIFAVPLAVVIVTGLILSFEPMAVTNAIKPGSLTTDHMLAYLDRHDPAGTTTRISLHQYNGTISLAGEHRLTLDAETGNISTGSDWLGDLFGSSRRMHERLIGDLGWLVEASTIVMLVLIGLGVFMGLPRLRNTLANWHKGVAWLTLPLLILSPLSALGILYGVPLAPPPSQAANQPPPAKTREAVQLIGAKHDLSALVSLRKRGKRLMARIVEGGEYRGYAVTKGGLVELPRNWSRLLHEGNWYGNVSALLNIVTSVALVALLVTGVWAWTRRSLARLRRRRKVEAVAMS